MNTSDSKQIIFEAKRTTSILKGHGNEPAFPKFLHKSVRHGSLFLFLFELFRFWLRMRGDMHPISISVYFLSSPFSTFTPSPSLHVLQRKDRQWNCCFFLSPNSQRSFTHLLSLKPHSQKRKHTRDMT